MTPEGVGGASAGTPAACGDAEIAPERPVETKEGDSTRGAGAGLELSSKKSNVARVGGEGSSETGKEGFLKDHMARDDDPIGVTIRAKIAFVMRQITEEDT